jgi:membrane protein implicated in regulation of membrane protease activity
MSDTIAQAWFLWGAAGLVLMVLEALAPGAFLIWLGAAALGTAGLVWLLPSGFAGQVAWFAGLAAFSLGTGMKMRKQSAKSPVNTQQSGLVGREARVLSFGEHEGRVRLGDSDWPARLAPHARRPQQGETRVVAGIDGMTLLLADRQETSSP